MDENVKNHQVNDDELENVSGGIDMETYEIIKNNNNTYKPEWMEQRVKEETKSKLGTRAYSKRTCLKCGKTFWYYNNIMDDDDVKNYCDLCRILKG